MTCYEGIYRVYFMSCGGKALKKPDEANLKPIKQESNAISRGDGEAPRTSYDPILQIFPCVSAGKDRSGLIQKPDSKFKVSVCKYF